MPDYLVTMITRLAALLDWLTPASIKLIEEWRTKGML